MTDRLPSWLLVSLLLLGLFLLANCTRGEFEVTRADGTTARGKFARVWTDTSVAASPENGFSYSSNPNAAQQQQLLDLLSGALLLRAPAPLAPPPLLQPAPQPAPPARRELPPLDDDPFRREPSSAPPMIEDREPAMIPIVAPALSSAPPPVIEPPSSAAPKSPLRRRLEEIARQLPR